MKIQILIMFFMLFVFSGCGYPEVSPQTYELAKAMYSACNRQDTEQLDKVDALINNSLKDKGITKREAKWLEDISSLARAGDWKSATLESRKILEDQVR